MNMNTSTVYCSARYDEHEYNYCLLKCSKVVTVSCRLYKHSSALRMVNLCCVWRVGLWQTVAMRKIRKFLSLQKSNCLSQPHVSNIARASHPLGTTHHLVIVNFANRSDHAVDDYYCRTVQTSPAGFFLWSDHWNRISFKGGALLLCQCSIWRILL